MPGKATYKSAHSCKGLFISYARSDGITLLRDDYKSTLETMHAALDLFAEVPAQRRIVLFGDVTEPPPNRTAVYEELGARVAGIADQLVVLGRGRPDYAAGALRTGMPAAAIHDGGTTPQQAVAVLRGLLRGLRLYRQRFAGLGEHGIVKFS